MAKPLALVIAMWMGVCAPVIATAADLDLSPFAAPSLVFGEQALNVPEAPSGTEVWQLDFGASTPAPVALPVPRAGTACAAPALDLHTAVPALSGEQTAVRRPTAYTYSEGYELRAKIHKYASFATLPLFGAQAYLGFKLDEGNASESVRATHAGIATAMVGLFGVNTVTGVWNLWEGRDNPAGRTRRLLHGMLMLASDAGFVATGLLAPTNDGGGNQSLHKSVALTSIGAATAGYLIMLFGQ